MPEVYDSTVGYWPAGLYHTNYWLNFLLIKPVSEYNKAIWMDASGIITNPCCYPSLFPSSVKFTRIGDV